MLQADEQLALMQYLNIYDVRFLLFCDGHVIYTQNNSVLFICSVPTFTRQLPLSIRKLT